MTSVLPLDLVDAVARAATAIAEHSAALGHRVELDALTELCRRDAVEAGAHDRSRLVPTADGWLAVNLARPDDADLVPAWLSPWLDPERVGGDPWSAISAVGRRVGAPDLLAGAIGFGLPVARVGERPPLGQAQLGGTSFAPAAGTRRRRPIDGLRVVDLSSLWAGPLCGAIFGRSGATVTKVESVGRPDGLRAGAPELFEHLNAGKQDATVDPTTEAGREELRALIAGADVVIEASRPRALQQLGIEVGDHLGQPGGPQLWVSITGYGRSEGQRVAFGDVAAAAGGLVAWDEAGAPAFLGDALADPLAGLAAAAAALAALDRGDAGLLDVSMADVAASVARPRRRRRRATDASTLRFDDVEVDGRRCSVLVTDGAIAAVADSVDAPAAAQRIDGRGGALLPGLHDHHVHLAAAAARARSVSVGPPAVRSTDDLRRVLTAAARQLPPGAWLRAVDHHASAG
ncbi:MAG TPA: CoA transferase, partial [Acidimicrobiales bacterium]